MGIERRKVYVEFFSKDGCQITTPFKQKAFLGVSDGTIIDLVQLTKLGSAYTSKHYFSNPPSSLFAVCAYLEDQIFLEVWAVISPSAHPENWGGCSLKEENNKNFEGNIWVND